MHYQDDYRRSEWVTIKVIIESGVSVDFVSKIGEREIDWSNRVSLATVL